jgi:hypothetical protein
MSEYKQPHFKDLEILNLDERYVLAQATLDPLPADYIKTLSELADRDYTSAAEQLLIDGWLVFDPTNNIYYRPDMNYRE